MASIPCAAYQASTIHAHMRRQNLGRSRHNSSASTDSDSINQSPEILLPLSGTASAPGLTKPPMSPFTTAAPTTFSLLVSQSSMDAVPPVMDRVSKWVGDHMRFRKWRQAHNLQNGDLSHQPNNGCLDKINPEVAGFSQSHVLKPSD